VPVTLWSRQPGRCSRRAAAGPGKAPGSAARPDKCQSGVIFAELGPLQPPAPPAAPSSVAWSEDSQLEALAARAGLTPLTVADVPNPLIYPDLATAVRTQLSSGPARNAIQHSGLPAVRGALTRAFAGSRTPDATYDREHLPLPRRPGLTIRACPAPLAPQRPHAPSAARDWDFKV